MYLIKKLIYCFRITHWIYPLCAAAIAALFGIVTLICCDSYPVYHFLLLPRNALPYWIFLCLSIILFALIGFAMGFLPALPGCRKQQYLILLYLATACVLLVIWFHVVFHSLSFLLSGIILMSVICIFILSLLKAIEICLPTALFVSLALVILLHHLWLNLSLLILN